MTEPRRCFYIPHGQAHPEHGFIPSLVVENEPGHSPMIGRDELSQPWFWGRTYKEAERICDQVNREMFGLSPAEAFNIVASSIRAQNKRDSRAASARVRYAEKLGQQPDPADRFLARREE